MANLKVDEQAAEIDDLKRQERYAVERGRAVDDILHRTIGELAEARTDRFRTQANLEAASVQLNRAHWNERRLVEHLTAAIDMIRDDHLKRLPRHRKSPAAAAHRGCKACQLLLRIEKDVQDFGKELAR